MIIKMTVHDNDFQDVMTRFCKQTANAQPVMPPEPRDSHAKTLWNEEWMKLHDAMRGTLGCHRTEATQEQKDGVIDAISRSFGHFVDHHCGLPAKTAAYLKKEFQCEIVDAVTDEWRNGEDFFIFASSYADKVLNF